MSEDPIKRALSGLPRESARPGFVNQVLARLPRQRAERPAWMRPWVLAAAGLALAGVYLAAWQWEQKSRAADEKQRRAALLQEHDELAAELERLRELSVRERPVLYLGGNEQLDVVLDLGRPADSLVHPAAYGNAVPPID